MVIFNTTVINIPLKIIVTCPTRPTCFNIIPPLEDDAATFPNLSMQTHPTVSNLGSVYKTILNY